MKKLWMIILAGALLGISQTNAQEYTFSGGLGFDLGEGETNVLVGPSAKYFFSSANAALAEVMFGSDVIAVTALYQYHGNIGGISGLRWFAGLGPTFRFSNFNSNRETDIGIRPNGGVEYRIPDFPLAFTGDWRPYISFDEGATEVGRFGIGVRYVID